jgi:hypothetical protein
MVDAGFDTLDGGLEFRFFFFAFFSIAYFLIFSGADFELMKGLVFFSMYRGVCAVEPSPQLLLDNLHYSLKKKKKKKKNIGRAWVG